MFLSNHRFFDVPGPIFAKLCRTTRYVLKLIMSCRGVHTCPLIIERRKKTNFRRFADPKSTLSATPFRNAREIGKSKQQCQSVATKRGGGPIQHRGHMQVAGAGKPSNRYNFNCMTASDSFSLEPSSMVIIVDVCRIDATL